jgi:hypothetical protein
MDAKMTIKIDGVETQMKARCWDFLTRMYRNSDEVAKLSNEVLASEILEKVWADMDMSTWESCLLDEAIQRLRKQSNVRRDRPEGAKETP